MRELRRFAEFNLVGFVTTVVGVPFMAFLDFLGVPYGVYTALNYLVGIVLGFGLNFRFAFADRAPDLRTALVRYLVTFLGLLALVQGLQWALIDGLGWPRWVGVGVGMVVYGGLGYLLSSRWVFARKAIPEPGFVRRPWLGRVAGRLPRPGHGPTFPPGGPGMRTPGSP